jgi:hypothetical protein
MKGDELYLWLFLGAVTILAVWATYENSSLKQLL